MRSTQITIHANALHHNLEQIHKLAAHTQMLLMLKSNAYGHGLDLCIQALLKIQNKSVDIVSAIGLASLQEAMEARALGWDGDIVLIEGVFSQDEWSVACEQNIQCVIHHEQQLEWALNNFPHDNYASQTIWLKHNTGMNRLGFCCDEVTSSARKLIDVGYNLVFTSHFANSDVKNHPLNNVQASRFISKLTELQKLFNQKVKASLCNSGGIVNFPEWHFDWVRPGIMAYGASPVSDKSAHELGLLPVMHLTAKIMAIHTLEAGELVGYGSTWQAQSASTIAIISIGYGDGYPRVVSEDAFVVINNAFGSFTCNIIGRVAMDMIMVDISNFKKNMSIDDTVVMWGNSPHIDEIALCANTISNELLCRPTTRPKRILI